MKFMISERIKHRITGLIVILSVIAIFVPAMIKKSNQRPEEKVSLSIHLPPKPIAPRLA